MTTVSGKQSVGTRDNQEDAFKVVYQSQEDPRSDVLMIVSDGMGGHTSGEIASTMAVKVFADHFVDGAKANRPRARLQECLLTANQALTDRIAQEPKLKGMGCTMIGALKMGDRLSWVSVGDSLVLLMRDGRLSRLNADHSLYGELVEHVRNGKMSQAEADSHPRRHALRSALMGDGISLIDLEAIELRPGDLIVLATDGLETLGQAEMLAILSQDPHADVRALGSDLLNAVEAKGAPSQDNTTVVLYRHQKNGASGGYADSRWTMAPAEAPVTRPGWLWPAIGGGAFVLACLGIIFAVTQGGPPEPPPVPEAVAPPDPATPSLGEQTAIEGAPRPTIEDPATQSPQGEAPVEGGEAETESVDDPASLDTDTGDGAGASIDGGADPQDGDPEGSAAPEEGETDAAPEGGADTDASQGQAVTDDGGGTAVSE